MAFPLFRRVAVVALVLHTTAACAQATPMNTLTAAEKKAGWQLLFDGKTTDGWRGYQMTTVPPAWHVVDGILTKATGTVDLITKEQFSNFELVFDWKLDSAGNAGAFYRASEEYNHIYWSGPEYQLLDDAAAGDGKNPLTSAGAAYGFYPSIRGVVKPANQWNSSRIVVKGNHVEHWLNGQKLLEYELGSPEWEAKLRASKFAVWPNYGRGKTGYIGFQGDHNGALSLRNIKLLKY